MGHQSTELAPVVVTLASWLWLIPLFPLVGAAINAVVGWKLQAMFGEPRSMKGGRGKQLVHFIAVGVKPKIASRSIMDRGYARDRIIG